MANGIYKKTLYNQKNKLVINLSDDFINKMIEVLIIPTDARQSSKIKVFDEIPESFHNPVKLKEIKLFSRDEIHER
ncbi:MAG: hypothetical protein PHW04_15160 [Candidatus Wallbacteria bacterium]|nr:hypothetical protein [Candidatus Wallbacteria bacterium]